MKSNRIFILVMFVAVAAVFGIAYSVGKGQSGSESTALKPVVERADMQSLVGFPAPDFTLADKSGTSYTLGDLRGKTVVLFFNEGIMCYPACWNQMAQLSSDARLNSGTVHSFSIVVDQARNWTAAVEQMPALASAHVLYDTDGSVSRIYGMLKAASSMHYGMFPGHSYVVIDPKGIVRYVYDDPRMAINNDKIAEEIASIGNGK